MRLADLEQYSSITIQCHDNPDADAIGAGFGLYCYFKSKHKKVRLVYSGQNRIKKKNLMLMKEKLNIPIKYIHPKREEAVSGLLITVDCQYGAGNVRKLPAEHVAIIDHHPQECADADHVCIQPHLGSCATLVWSMLKEEGFPINENMDLGTALYYGLFTDTNQFSELFNPLDMDMREEISYNKRLLAQFRNSNISLKELEIAGIAMIRYNYNDDYRFAVIKAQPCDPNILGLISDFLLQVEEIDTCVVYNEINDGYKLSVRSCIKEVNANELAAFLTEGIGSGGGHEEKAGGFISMRLYEEKYPVLHSEAYFSNRMTEYFDSYTLIFAKQEEVDSTDMQKYRRKAEIMCYVEATDIAGVGQRISLRRETDTMDIEVEEDMYFAVERDGTLHVFPSEHFKKYIKPMEGPVAEEYFAQMSYMPTVKVWADGNTYSIKNYLKMGMPTGDFCIYAKTLTSNVKVFPKWDDERYMRGMPGDYLAVSEDDSHNIFIEDGSDFLNKFEPVAK